MINIVIIVDAERTKLAPYIDKSIVATTSIILPTITGRPVYSFRTAAPVAIHPPTTIRTVAKNVISKNAEKTFSYG